MLVARCVWFCKMFSELYLSFFFFFFFGRFLFRCYCKTEDEVQEEGNYTVYIHNHS